MRFADAAPRPTLRAPSGPARPDSVCHRSCPGRARILGDGSMATPVENSTPGKDPRGFSGLDESQLEKSILRRGLATATEVEACKTQRKQLAAKEKDEPKSLLEIMVENKVLTRSQMVRLLQEAGESNRKFQISGYQVIQKLGKGSMGVVYKARQLSVD